MEHAQGCESKYRRVFDCPRSICIFRKGLSSGGGIEDQELGAMIALLHGHIGLIVGTRIDLGGAIDAIGLQLFFPVG